eukprot:7682201-Alexandrium_andersonii.AAC.1
MGEQDHGPLEDIPSGPPPSGSDAAMAPSGADGQGAADMQQGQAGKAQRCDRKAALKEARRKERQEQQ